MSKHTPGPWVAKHWNGGQYGTYYTIHDAAGNEIANYVKPDIVNLIILSPELLEALESMIELWVSTCKSNGHNFDVYSEYIAGIEILKKAKGQQK